MHSQLLKEFRLAFDSGDPWGSAIEWGFAIAETLYVLDEDIPSHWEFRASPFLASETFDSFRERDEGYAYEVVTDGIADSEWHADDLRYVGNVLLRYCDLCKRKGLDY